MVLGGVAVAVGSVFASSGSRAQGDVVGMLVVGLLVAALGVGQFWVGRGLRRLESWARTVSAILCGIGLLGFPVGTLINGYILYLLWSAKGKTIFTAEYRSVVEQTPHMKYKTSVVVWVVLGVLVLLVLAGIFAAVWR